MRVVVCGKGGVGKTTIAGALCAALAERGVEVIAIDADGSPNLALTLGAGDPEDLPAVANRVPASPSDACDTGPLTASEIIAGFSVQALEHVSLVQTGRIERPSHRCLCCGSHTTAREVIAALPVDEHEVVVADLEPGINDLLWANPRPNDLLVIVTDASAKSQEITRRMLSIADELGVERTVVVANKIRPDETEAVEAAFGHVEKIVIPYDPTLEGRTPDGSKPTQARDLAKLLTATPG